MRGKFGDSLRAWISWPRIYRWLVFLSADSVVVAVAVYLAFFLRFEGEIPARYVAILRRMVPIALAVKLPIFLVFRTYRFAWAYVGLEEIVNVVLACGVGSLALAALPFSFQHGLGLAGLPRSVLVIDFAFTLLGVVGIRLSKRTVSHLLSRGTGCRGARRALVVGAGEAGEQLVRSLKRDGKPGFWPIGFVDDSPRKLGVSIRGVPVLGPRSQLPKLLRLKSVDTVIIAMPSAPSRVIRETVELARKGGAKEIKVVPFLSELYTGELRVSDMREVRPEDILPREPASVDLRAVDRFLRGKKVLVTGAAGSIGSELCRQILRFSPAQLLAVDFDETGLFNLELDLFKLFPKADVQVIVADIRDRAKMWSVFHRESPDLVFHAAAYKHVPMMENYPEEAVKTNIFGTQVVVQTACRVGVEAFVLISTDKAVNPVSMMGMSKRVAEMTTLAVGQGTSTRCMAVRFGNVLGSRGSVIPTFLEQIRRGGPVTVTHPDMKRYFMTTSEAVLLVLQAATVGNGGEVFVLDMGEPVKILDIAKDLIRFHGLEPDEDIPIVFTGIRPGEKLFEELLTAEEGTQATRYEQIFVAKMNGELPSEVLQAKLHELAGLIEREVEGSRLKEAVKEIIYGSRSLMVGDKEGCIVGSRRS
jgi:FlaA1/EpsC-like NDP-sugar epimerase